MRINTNVSAIVANNNLNKTQNAIQSSSEKLSSGFRINHAADDAAGLAVANTFRSDIRALSQAQRNAEQASAVVQIAEGGVSSVQKLLERMKELAAQAHSDTVGSTDRDVIQVEFASLIDEIDRVGQSTEFGGKSLLDGNYVGSFLVGAARNADYATWDMASSVTPAADTTINALYMDGSVLDVSTTTLGVDGLDVSGDDGTGAQAALEAIDLAFTQVGTAFGNIGALQNRLTNAVDNVKTTIANYQSAESTIRDLDVATEMVSFSKNQILAQAGTAMLAQANQSGQGILKLLQ